MRTSANDACLLDDACFTGCLITYIAGTSKCNSIFQNANSRLFSCFDQLNCLPEGSQVIYCVHSATTIFKARVRPATFENFNADT